MTPSKAERDTYILRIADRLKENISERPVKVKIPKPVKMKAIKPIKEKPIQQIAPRLKVNGHQKKNEKDAALNMLER